MCGIAGFVSIQPLTDAETALRRMTEAIVHRGPDDYGYHIDSHAALGHRRLSIVDLSGGHQPMCDESHTKLIVYNGEIFNHADLRPALERAGHSYASRCDTETIIHAFEEHGPGCLNLFRGMFAFAIWDQQTKQLFCARDRLGIKPLYYFQVGGNFVFASEIKALLEHPAVPLGVNEALLPEYLAFGFTSSEETLFRGVRKLMPGHWLIFDASGASPSLRVERYWDPPAAAAAEPERSWREQDWIQETRRRLEETVRMRLMSDVPLGMFLSGGVDSSAIAALIRRMADGPVKTFSVGYAEARYSELSYAADVARRIGTDHHEVTVGMDDFFTALPRMIWHEDEPIAWPSSVSLYFVSQLASRQVKVVLTGEGSDELFGGYERYRWNLLNARAAGAWNVLPGLVRRGVRNGIAASKFLSADVRRKARHTFIGRENTVEALFLDNFYCAFSRGQQNALLQSDPRAVYGNYLRYWKAREDSSLLSRMLYADQKTYLVELLMKQDQMSMAASIESRVPFLDHTLVEFAARIPDRLKIKGNVQKYVLKKAVEDLLPQEIVHRTKMGFPTPLRQWLLANEAAPLYEALADRRGFLASFLNMSEVDAAIERHRSGFEDATDRIWRLLNLQLWGDVFFTGKREPVARGEAHTAV